MLRRLLLAAPCALALLAPADAFAQKTIKVGFPMILSGPGALFGEPSLKGAQMFVEEVNAKGGVLGRKIQLIPRDTKGNADEAVRCQPRAHPQGQCRLPRRHADLGRRPGRLDDRQGEQDRLHRADHEDGPADGAGEPASLRLPHRLQHDDRRAHARPRSSRSGTGQADRHDQPRLRLRPGRDEGLRRAHEEDQARHRDRRPAVAEARRGRLHAVHQRADVARSRRRCSPRSGAGTSSPSPSRPSRSATSTPSSTTSSAPARPARSNRRRRWVPTTRSASGPTATTCSTGKAGPAAHKDYIARLKEYTKQDPPSSWPLIGYIGMQFLVEAHREGQQHRRRQGGEGAARTSPTTRRSASRRIRAKDHQANRGQFWGKTMMDAKLRSRSCRTVLYIDPAPFMD